MEKKQRISRTPSVSGTRQTDPSNRVTAENLFPITSELPPEAVPSKETDHNSHPAMPDVTKPISINIGDPDLTNPSMSSTLLALKERHTVQISKKRKGILAAITLLFIIPIPIVIWQLTIFRTPEQAPNAIMDHSSPPIQAAAYSTPSPSPISPQNKDTVTIRINGLPEGATVQFNQNPTSLPIRVPQSNTPQFIEVIKDNEKVFSTSVIPAKDQFIEIPATKTQLTQRQKVEKRRPKVQKSFKNRKKRRSGSLSSNPFPLKTNPFSTGE